ncbi:MAG: 5'-methylthioadenosine/S-adenosylhomocysteine nucleosidase [Chloroflexi bacterium]|nr:5'-methylthioadenosine/S-adenosylhomocysteine nucleosidase [Chloroflexota bacterium]
MAVRTRRLKPEIYVLVLVPQLIELDQLLAAMGASGFAGRAVEVGRLQATLIEDLGLLLSVGGHGKTELALRGQHLLEQFGEVSALVCAGAAGSLQPDVRSGDVVVGTCSIEHDYKLRFRKAEPPNVPADERIVAELRASAAARGPGFRVNFGPIASGDEDIVDVVRALDLHRETGALCVAWEGAGAARLARFNGIPFVEIRAITDSADGSAARDFRGNLPTVMPNLAEVIAGWAVARLRRTARAGVR